MPSPIRALSLLSACLVGLCPLRAEEPAAATFLADTAVTTLDEFPGKAANGWEDGWKVLLPSSYERRVILEVNRESPLPETPGCLVIRGQDASVKQTLLRRIPSTPVVHGKEPYTVTLKARVDSLESESDGVIFTFSCQPEEGTQGPSSSIWHLAVQNGRWCAVGRSKSGDGLMWHRFPLPVLTNVVYTFHLEVSPAEGTYRATISNDAGQVESPELHFPIGNAWQGKKKELLLRVGSTSARFAFSVAGLEIRLKE